MIQRREIQRDPDQRQTRREGYTVVVEHPAGSDLHYAATVNLDSDSGEVFEIFYTHVDKIQSPDGRTHSSPVKEGSALDKVLRDGTILVSLLHQRGGLSFAEIAAALGEDREPGARTGPPSTIIGALCRAASDMEKEHS